MSQHEKTKNLAIRIGIIILGMVFTAIGSALSLKAEIGVGAWDALGQSLSYITNIKVGSVLIVLNLFCITGQVLILREKFRWFNLFQIPMSIFLGSLVNYILYDLLGNVMIDTYVARLFLLVIGTVIMSIALAAMVAAHLISLPVEALCNSIALAFDLNFGKVRTYFDFGTIAATIVLTLIFQTEWTLREGSIIATMILGPLMGILMPKFEALYRRYDII